MLNLNCVICTEILTPSSDAYVTKCGHVFHQICLLQWMERSKTCPQCRNKCTNRDIFKLYFNLSNLDSSKIDIGSVQEKLDNALLQLNLREKEIKSKEEEKKKLKETQKKCMKTISGLEDKLKKYEFMIQNYTEELKIYKLESKNVAALQNEIKELKKHIETMEDISAILVSSKQDADKLLQNEKDPKVLSVWVSALKRELRICESKKVDLRNILQVVQNDLRKENGIKKKHEERISQLESENYQLNEKIKNLEIEGVKAASQTSSAQKHNTDNLSSLSLQSKELQSPTSSENMKKIEESNSPYLNIKSSSIGLVPLFKRYHDNANRNLPFATTLNENIKKNRKIDMDSNLKFSIFKKPRIGGGSIMLQVGASKNKNSNYVFNGFGGSDKRSYSADNEDDDNEEDFKAAMPATIRDRLKAAGLKV